MSRPLIAYHVKTPSIICFDGFCSAALLWGKFGDNADYVPVVYHQTLPLDTFRGRDVYFVDFSYDVDRMDAIAKVSASLKVFDHHIKSCAFAGRDYVISGKAACSSVMVWNYFYAGKPLPYMVELIDDGARNLNTHPEVRAFHAALSLEERSFKNWLSLMDRLVPGSDGFRNFISRGELLDSFDQIKVDMLVKEAFPIKLCGIPGLAVNSNKFFAHRVAIKLAEYSRTFGAVFYVRPDGNVEVSLRRLDPDIDVQKIAATFGGDGHAGAAGFSVSLNKFKELMHPECKSDLYTRIDASVKNFQAVLNANPYIDIEHTKELLLQHLQSDLGTPIADGLRIEATESVRHPGSCVRVRSALARLLGLPKVVDKPRWYHRFFPYIPKKEAFVDEDLIRDVLLESRDNGKDLNQFLVERLLETVDFRVKLELVTSIYYIHVEVSIPGSRIKIKHSFEVTK